MVGRGDAGKGKGRDGGEGADGGKEAGGMSGIYLREDRQTDVDTLYIPRRGERKPALGMKLSPSTSTSQYPHV